MATLEISVTSAIAILVISRVDRRNALDTDTWALLAQACEMIAKRDDIKAVVLTGAGEHFSAGADIHELRNNMTDASWMAHNQAAIARALDAYAALPQPTIAKFAVRALVVVQHLPSHPIFAIARLMLALPLRLPSWV
ncbi:MAG: enoyl-CoA hydratase/isomerase family protein [Gammaproteobacteria bacterium]|nr:enoyl-CoA hydratase/isomerase family protein [Gammaproteobacteria bacterium]